MKIVLVAAARPNFMKVAPLLRALESEGVEVHLVHTGQHYDPLMTEIFFDELGIRSPDTHLSVGSGSHAYVTAQVMLAFEPVLAKEEPDALIVVGDVNSTLACALVASKMQIPIAHVEAGLRARDYSMPEEVNRICTDHMSDWLFTTSSDADANLLAEGCAEDRIFLVGNVMIDTLLHCRGRVDPQVLHRRGLVPGKYALLTLHRPSNVDDPGVFMRLLAAVNEIADEIPVVFPVHPRTRALVEAAPRLSSGVLLDEPLGYMEFLALMDSARVVLTDSGGIQEETTVLGVPCLTLRETTERPITVTNGSNTVVGTRSQAIMEAYRRLDPGTEFSRPALWDGAAAERVAHVLLTTPPPLARMRRSHV